MKITEVAQMSEVAEAFHGHPTGSVPVVRLPDGRTMRVVGVEHVGQPGLSAAVVFHVDPEGWCGAATT